MKFFSIVFLLLLAACECEKTETVTTKSNDVGSTTTASSCTLVQFFHDNDDDGFGATTSEVELLCAEMTHQFFVRNFNDCNDKDAAVHPGATELCDAVDNNCNGSADACACEQKFPGQIGVMCTGKFGACSVVGGLECVTGDKLVCSTDIGGMNSKATAEICDGIDNDCDGETDEGPIDPKSLGGPVMPYFPDVDGDGYGDSTKSLLFCSGTKQYGWSDIGNDCDTENFFIHPNQAENCQDNLDNNCDGQINEGCPAKIDPSEVDADGDGFTAKVDCDDNDEFIGAEFNGCASIKATKDTNEIVIAYDNMDFYGKTLTFKEWFGAKDFYESNFDKASWNKTTIDKESNFVEIKTGGGCGFWFNIANYQPGGAVNLMSDDGKFTSASIPKIFVIKNGKWINMTAGIYGYCVLPDKKCVMAFTVGGDLCTYP